MKTVLVREVVERKKVYVNGSWDELQVRREIREWREEDDVINLHLLGGLGVGPDLPYLLFFQVSCLPAEYTTASFYHMPRAYTFWFQIRSRFTDSIPCMPESIAMCRHFYELEFIRFPSTANQILTLFNG
jgi:hypothetical protein